MSWDGLARSIAEYLEQHGVLNFETGVGGNTFVERNMPASPDEAFQVRSTGGFEASAGQAYDSPTVQVLCRASTPKRAIEMAWAVYNVLHGLTYTQLPAPGPWVVYMIGMQSGPIPLGQDDNGRHTYSANFRLEVAAPTAHRGGN